MNKYYICDIDGIRIDKFISESEADGELSRSAITRLIENDNCFVNGRTVKKNYKLKRSDVIELIIPKAAEIELISENIPLQTAYEDDDVIVINKKRGMTVHPSHGHENGTLVNALMHHCKGSLSGINGVIRPGIVHRIDMNTSGLLIVAKNDFSHIKLAEQIKSHSLKREYEAIVVGSLKENGIIDSPIGRHKTERKKMCVTSVNSKNAVTHYSVIENFGNYTHIRLKLETGRTHQIRVHMSYIGHAVCGDNVYGNGKPKWLGGQCLHSKTLGFIHPVNNEYIEVDSELPDYFIKMLNEIK